MYCMYCIYCIYCMYCMYTGNLPQYVRYINHMFPSCISPPPCIPSASPSCISRNHARVDNAQRI